MTLVQLDSTVVSKTADVGSSPTCRAEREVTSPSDALFGQFQRRREIKLTAAPFGWTRTLELRISLPTCCGNSQRSRLFGGGSSFQLTRLVCGNSLLSRCGGSCILDAWQSG